MSHQSFPKAIGSITDGYTLTYSAADGYWKPIQPGTPRYYGYTTGNQLWNSTTWADITTVTTLVDDSTAGINRSNSTFTVTKSGIYVFYASMNFFGNGEYLALRIRNTTNNITLSQRTVFSATGTQSPGIINSIVRLQTGTNYNLQYAVKGGSAAQWNVNDPIDGETMRTGEIAIYYIGV